MGGNSREREISLASGQAVFKALDPLASKNNWQVEKIDIVDFKQTAKKLINEQPDLVFLTLHGRFGEDGSIQGLCEWLGIPFTGPRLKSSALCFSKSLTKILLNHWGLPTPKSFSFTQNSIPTDFKSLELSFPVIVKPNSEGSTVGITKVIEPNHLPAAVETAFSYDQEILIEEYITGREVTVGFLGDEILPIVEIIVPGGFYDFQAKYQSNETRYEVPAKLNSELENQIKQISQKIKEVFELDGAFRIDFLLDANDQPYVLEINTIPGMTQTSLLPKAAKQLGYSFEKLCEKMVKLALA